MGAILGPVLGGLLAASGASLGDDFLAFAVPAVVGALIVSVGPRTRGRGEETASRTDVLEQPVTAGEGGGLR